MHSDILYFGTLAQRSVANRKLLDKLIASNKWEIIFCDLNLRSPFFNTDIIANSLKQCTILKMNEDEAQLVARYFFSSDLSLSQICANIACEFQIALLLVTFGSRGVYIFENGHLHFTPSHPATVVDSIGAGDAFSAAFVHSICRGRDRRRSAEFACRLAEFVVGQTGAVPDYTSDFAAQALPKKDT